MQNKMNNVNIPISIRVGLAKTGISQKSLAENVHITQTYLSRIMKGKSEPSFELIKSMASYFLCDVSVFISWGESRLLTKVGGSDDFRP